MHDVDLILTLAGGLTAALVLGFLTHRLGSSPIVGYLLAGAFVGPHTPGFVADARIAEQLAGIGVVLLMFGVGLQFHLHELLAVRNIAVPGAIGQIAAATSLGAWIARMAGWSWPGALVFGLSLSVASTVVLVRVLSDNNELHTRTGHIAVGWLVVEDLFTVVALVLLPAMLGPEASSSRLPAALAVTALKVSALVAFIIFVGARLIPFLLGRVARTRSRELFTLTVLVLALGIALGSALLFGVSMALGAFLAGMVVGRSDFSQRAASEALPMRDAFAVLFFVSVGMLFDPRSLFQAPVLLAATLAVVVIGKPLAALLITRLMRYPFRVSLSVAVALAQIGEFSFMLSALGKDMGLLTNEATNALIAASIASIVLNPVLYCFIGPVERWASRRPMLSAALNPRADHVAAFELPEPPPLTDARHRAVVVGFGPTGRTVTRLLRENGVEPTVVELNMESVRALRDRGQPAVYGDAAHRDTLHTAGLSRAATLVLTSAGMRNSEDIIRFARELNPDVHMLARTQYLRDIDALRRAGADGVFSGEGEVALALTEAILDRLGATPEQLDRERARTRGELSGFSGPEGRATPDKT
jgi:CPA2 family monovalent cation:H+ antiporter-2